jgi:hypothetical protein
MLVDFIGTEVFENDVVVCPSPYFPTVWVKATVESISDGFGTIKYVDSKKRVKYTQKFSGGQFILARGSK